MLVISTTLYLVYYVYFSHQNSHRHQLSVGSCRPQSFNNGRISHKTDEEYYICEMVPIINLVTY